MTDAETKVLAIKAAVKRYDERESPQDYYESSKFIGVLTNNANFIVEHIDEQASELHEFKMLLGRACLDLRKANGTPSDCVGGFEANNSKAYECVQYYRAEVEKIEVARK